jgi:SecD/SecF fusion protein
VLPEGYALFRGDVDSNGGLEGTNPETGEPVRWYLMRDEPVIWGQHLRSVQARQGGQFGTDIVVAFELTGEGTRHFRDATDAHKPTAEQSWRLAIVLEGRVRSAPVIQEAIPFGRGQISGSFTFEEASNLQNILRTGALPARLEPGELSVVGPSLGEESIRSGRDAALIGAAVVLVFMLLYYSAAGGLAVIAVVMNVCMVLGILSMIRATLTLPGIAGIILTIGMAVDANVLIFERIREELRAGKSLRNAIGVGFSRAFSAILDANVTTLITALVLLQFGFGPVRGFALTMTFGIFATLFTGLFVTQVLMSVYFNLRQALPLGKAHFLTATEFNFIGLRHAALIFSFVLVAASLGDLIHNRGPHLGVDFTGGVQMEIAADETIGRGEVESTLNAAGFENPRVQTITRRGQAESDREDPGGAVEATEDEAMAWESNFLIRIPESEMQTTDDGAADFVATEEVAMGSLEESFPVVHFEVLATRAVEAETGARLRATAIGIVIVAALGIFIYVAIRFDRIYGAAALVALFHDVFITLGVVTLLNVDLSLDVVAALLTIMGYSLNDTIVCFDRMRENRGLMEGRDIFTVTNLSINQVLSRTIITSGTTLFAVGALLVLGGPGVWDFALTLFVGFTIGTYSSIFVAAPLVAQRVRRRQLLTAESG